MKVFRNLLALILIVSLIFSIASPMFALTIETSNASSLSSSSTLGEIQNSLFKFLNESNVNCTADSESFYHYAQAVIQDLCIHSIISPRN